MNCWHCKTELVWGCDYDISDENEEFSMETILNCPNCDTMVCIYYPKEEKE